MTPVADAICMVASTYESLFLLVIAPSEIVLRHAIGSHRSAIIEVCDARAQPGHRPGRGCCANRVGARAVLTDSALADPHLEIFRFRAGETELAAAGRQEIL